MSKLLQKLKVPLYKICGILIKDDATFLRIKYRLKVGKKLNLNNPHSYNEKLQWLKINYRRPEYTTMVDKYLAKEYVAEIIGKEYIIPTLGVWDKFEDINFEKLPDQFVLKCTHDSGGLVICKDKSKLDIKSAKKIINRSLRINFYLEGREYPYKNVKPRIIAEKYLVDESGTELKDYKFFCFNGKAKCIQLDFGRYSDHKRNLYSLDWTPLHFSFGYPSDYSVIFNRPQNLEQMIKIAEKLSEGIPHIRVDLYNINGEIYFGELTFFHGSGLEKFDPEDWGEKFGSWLALPMNKENINAR